MSKKWAGCVGGVWRFKMLCGHVRCVLVRDISVRLGVIFVLV